jgi:hypothetical protein
MPKIERSTSPKVQSVSRAVETTPAAPAAAVAAAPSTSWGPKAAQKDMVPRGANVSKTASPDALWGAKPKVDLDIDNFKELEPAEQKKVVEAAQIERAELGTEISQRVETLDRKWKNSRLSTRTEALREFHERGGRKLDRRTRQKLDGLVGRSEESQRRINALRVQIDALPKTPEAKKQQAELRSQLAKELRRARDEQSKVVKEATELVDSGGLKVDRLAETEQIIDPSAPPQGSGESLLDKIVRFVHLENFFNFFQSWAATATEVISQNVEQRGQRIEEEGKRKDLDRLYRTLLERTQHATKDVEHARTLVATLQEPSATLNDA